MSNKKIISVVQPVREPKLPDVEIVELSQDVFKKVRQQLGYVDRIGTTFTEAVSGSKVEGTINVPVNSDHVSSFKILIESICKGTENVKDKDICQFLAACEFFQASSDMYVVKNLLNRVVTRIEEEINKGSVSPESVKMISFLQTLPICSEFLSKPLGKIVTSDHADKFKSIFPNIRRLDLVYKNVSRIDFSKFTGLQTLKYISFYTTYHVLYTNMRKNITFILPPVKK